MKDDSAALVAEKNRLEDSNNTLQQRFTQMQTQMSAVLKQKSELQEEVRRWAGHARARGTAR
jgi:FtsZ-binding cell division protein ZapB